MSVIVQEQGLAAANTFTTKKTLTGNFNLDISGTWVGTITTQRFFQTGIYEGQHTGAGNAAALTDGKQAWTADSLIGMYIVNVTDGSQAIITDNTATTVTATLAGGTDNDWDVGDVYEIWRDVQSGIFTGNTDSIGSEIENGVYYRAGFKTGEWTSGTAHIRFSK